MVLPPGDAGAIVPTWNRLAARAASPALQSGPAWAASMATALPSSARGPILLAAHAGRPDDLTGIALMERCGRAPWRPFPILQTWRAPMMFSGMPLLDANAPHEALVAMLSAARRSFGARAVLFRRIETGSAVARAFARAAAEWSLPMQAIEPRACAALDAQGDFETWFDATFPRKRRKEYRRLRSRLAETGRLESVMLEAGDSLDQWIEDFVALEQSGWKGRRGTAIGCDEHSRAFLRTALGELRRRGELAFWKLSLDGSPVAMLFALVGQGRAWLVKMAYDESHARFSPGVLVTLDATRELMRRGDIGLVDSCAVPNHPMIDHLWPGRLAVADLLVATPETSAAAFQAVLAGERARRRSREAAKTLYHRYMHWKGSRT